MPSEAQATSGGLDYLQNWSFQVKLKLNELKMSDSEGMFK
jgi:hypothetical protein